MAMFTKVGGTWRQSAPSVRVGGTWRTVQNGWVRVAGVWQQFYSGFSASAAPTLLEAFAAATGPINVTATTADANVTVSGGAGPFTYLWEYVAGNTAVVNSSSSASTSFTRAVFMNPGDPQVNRSGSYRCRVTDSLSAVVYSNAVTINTEHTETT
jgi:hypothetical protein